VIKGAVGSSVPASSQQPRWDRINSAVVIAQARQIYFHFLARCAGQNDPLGVVPIVNLELIQKIARDNKERGYSAEATVDTILRRMPDYINHICPQFSQTDINFQRVPTVDTSNPFMIRDIPTPDESFVIIHFRKGAREKWGIDFTYLLDMIHDSFMSSPTSIVVNGGKMGFAMELILTPIIHRMIEEKKTLA
jgi:phosphoribulokinase